MLADAESSTAPRPLTTGKGSALASKANLNLWKSGQSGNPKGRPRDNDSLMLRVRQATNNGVDIVTFLVSVLTGRELHPFTLKQTGVVVQVPPLVSDRLHAAEILLDRGWGKPLASLELSGPSGGPLQVMEGTGLDGLTTEELRVIVAQREVLIQQRERLLALIEAQGGSVGTISEEVSPPGITKAVTEGNTDAVPERV